MTAKAAMQDVPLVGRGERFVTTALLWFLAAMTLVPIGLIIAKALDAASGGVTLDNLRRAWEQGNLDQALKSSFIVTAVVVVLTTTFSTLAGYAIAVIRPHGTRLFFVIFVLGMLIPFEALIIPLYYALRDAGITNTYWSLILPQSALSLSFGIYWMRGFFLGVPTSVLEAARVEGASHLRTLTTVVLPMARPAIGTLVLLCFMWNWNEFLMPLVMVTDQSLQTAPLALAQFQARYSVDTSAQASAALLIATPILVLYIALNRRFMSGFTGTRT